MSLPWVRIDTGLAQHPKMLDLLNDPHPQRWRAGLVYVFGIGWSAMGGTDGHIPVNALPAVHATRTTADLLTHYRLWEPTLNGWAIHNYAIRQELTVISEAKRMMRVQAAERAACARWHGPACWGPKGCSRGQSDGRVEP